MKPERARMSKVWNEDEDNFINLHLQGSFSSLKSYAKSIVNQSLHDTNV